MKVKLKYVSRYKDRHGKLRTYYRRGKAPQQAIEGDPGSDEWLANYHRIHQGFELPSRPAPDHQSFKMAVRSYMATPHFKGLSQNTQDNHRYSLNRVAKTLGNWHLEKFTRGEVNRIRDTIAQKSPTGAMQAVRSMKQVFDHALDLELIKINPAAGIKKITGYKTSPHEKWTKRQINDVLERADGFAVRAMMVLLYTGLRCSDACSLLRSDIKDNEIELNTQKTDSRVLIPIHSNLQAELRRPLSVESIYLISGARGQQMTRHTVYSAMRRQFDLNNLGEMPPIHGLRKNAVISLIESGCTPREVQAITGQSLPTIEHYASDYDRRATSKRAMSKWENIKNS